MKSRDELITDTLKACSDQLTHLSARYAALDAKAQGTATIGGVLLGSALAFVPQASFESVIRSELGDFAVIAARLVLVTAGLGIAFAVGAMQIRSVALPFRGDLLSKQTLDLLQLPDDATLLPFIERHYQAQIGRWRTTLAAFAHTLDRKARILRIAQGCVLTAALFVALFVWIAISARQGAALPTHPKPALQGAHKR